MSRVIYATTRRRAARRVPYRPSFVIGGGDARISKFRKNETVKILRDCTQYVCDFLIGSGHLLRSLLDRFCRLPRD
jgi:hypothetical protein